jgi:hypothetical protein
VIRRALHEPLLHFAVLGAMVFIGYSWIASPTTSASHILVSSDQLRSLQAQFAATWQRAPNRDELQKLIDNFIREEILYREGVAMGLDREDPVVRNRVKLKMEFVGEDTLSTEPTDAELAAWFALNPDRFELPSRVSFSQVFFDPARHGDRLSDVVRDALAKLKAGTASAADSGDRTLLPGEAREAPAPDVARQFGDGFGSALDALPLDSWAGPIRSSFGMHLVRVTSRTPGQLPAFSDARDVVKREWTRERTAEIRERFYQSLRARYSVTVEAPP